MVYQIRRPERSVPIRFPVVATPLHGGQSTHEPRTCTPSFVADWTTLRPGDLVHLHQGAQRVAAGRIDAITYDGTVLWLQESDGNGRRMYVKHDGFQVRITP